MARTLFWSFLPVRGLASTISRSSCFQQPSWHKFCAPLHQKCRQAKPTMSVLQGFLRQDSCFEIVVDNARSHPSEAKSSLCASSAYHRGMRPQSVSSPHPARSRWECGTAPPQDHLTLLKQDSPSTTTATQSICCNVTKPERRRSIENTDILKQLHDSLSRTEENDGDDETPCFANMTAGELLAMALEELDSSFELLLEESSTSDSSDLMQTEE